MAVQANIDTSNIRIIFFIQMSFQIKVFSDAFPWIFPSFIFLPFFISFRPYFFSNKKGGKENFLFARRRSWLDFFYSIKCQVLSWIVSKGPRLTSTCTWYLPLKSSGTRHEYRHVPPQPYSNLPEARTLPASSIIFTFGAGALLLFSIIVFR